MQAISIKNLVKTYADGTKALKGVSLNIDSGDFFALLGANGAGKTTLIGILTDLVRKTSGGVRVFGLDIEQDFSRIKKMIGIVPQEFNFNMFEKCQDIVVTQAGYFGIDRRQALKESEDLLKRLGIWEKRHAPSRALSGGMKRRLMIARALVHRPKLLILDEPTAGVDVELRHGMWDYLRELNGNGVTILLTTHYLEEVEQLCRHVAIIKNGEIIKREAVRNLIQLLDRETYVVTLKEIMNLDKIHSYHPLSVDHNMIEVELNRHEGLHLFLNLLHEAGMVVTDIRPKGYRMEKLYLNIMKEA
jgi:ABC-2 type transport system ATP-binding protein